MIRVSQVLGDVYAVVESEAVKLTFGGDFESRFRELSKCIVLDDAGTREIAVFRFEKLDEYRAIAFNIERERHFVWQVLDYMFDKQNAKELILYSSDREAAHPYRGSILGQMWNRDERMWWRLTADEFLTARRMRVPEPEADSVVQRRKRRAAEAEAA